ncbi:MAG TPA: TonB-dependent receptor [Proteiniphilum sp.]|nr:TonB-dependent receptor [Proteiniphilum sp.]HPJ50920.1 TonB-dependent receptor [Proteiniphilum sp.]HPR19105.1 TonB-dependent receptor [Proteiniphilum sp.]
MGKIPMKRRLMLLLSLFVLGTVMLSAQKVNLNYSKATLRTVLESITEQTGHTLAFSKEVVNLNEEVTIREQNTELETVLKQLLTPRQIGYEIRENKIYIFDQSLAETETGQPVTQQVNLTGRVKDENGEPVIGANISVPGTTTGTVTDYDGYYALTVPKGSTLRFSYIGYLDREYNITSQTQLNVQLLEDTEVLDELIVVGYGVQRKSVVTAAISKVTAEELNVTRPSRVEDALKGKVSGVQITQSSGQPGSDSKVRIRGIGTINNSEPLYIVDGMIVGGGINYLNPVDIESVEILKDAASAAIYGARAANGVILVTTKKGTKGKASVNYDVSYGWQNPWKKREILNAEEYMVIMNEMQLNDGNLPRYNNEQVMGAGVGTDWQDETFYYNAPVQNHQVSVSGGSDDLLYFLSFGFFDQAGIVGGNYDKSNYRRYSLRSNSTYTVFEADDRSFLNKVTVGANIGYSRDKSTGIETNSEYGSILGSALTFSPLVSVYADEATAAGILAQYPHAVTDGDRVFSLPPAGFQEIANPVGMLHQPSAGFNNSDKFVSSFWGELQILPELKFRTTYGADLAFWGYDSYTFPYFLATQGKDQQFSTVQSEMNRGYSWQLENYLSYAKSFNEVHNLSAVAGVSASRYRYRNLGGNDRDLLETSPSKANINSAIADRQLERAWGGTGGYDFTGTASYFGRVDYNYAERYMLQATMRRDGSTSFGPNNKWGVFPSFSVGWNMTNEAFMANRPEWFDYMKLRFSWGKNGNDRIGNFLYTSLMNGGQNYYFGGGYQVNEADPAKVGEITGSMQYGSSPGYIPNPNVKWEESVQTDLGLEARFLNSRLTFGFDYFVKATNDMLMYQPIPSYVGLGAPIANVGDMENRGVEFELGWKNSAGDFNYFIAANASYLQNKLINLGNETGEQIYENAGASGVGSYVKGMNGEVFPYFYGFKTDGLFQNQAEVDGYVNGEGARLQPTAKPGDVRFVDHNGDGTISDDDKTKIGKGAPDWTYGLTLGADWKGFDANLFFQGTYGNDIFDFAQRGDIPAANRPAWILDRWHGEGTSNRMPRMTSANPNSNWRSSDLYIKDGSYVRLKSAQLGYTLPDALTKKISIQRLRLYVSADNLLTFTGYDGFDPEIASGGYTTIGIDRGIYPQARTISLGANISF